LSDEETELQPYTGAGGNSENKLKSITVKGKRYIITVSQQNFLALYYFALFYITNI